MLAQANGLGSRNIIPVSPKGAALIPDAALIDNDAMPLAEDAVFFLE